MHYIYIKHMEEKEKYIKLTILKTLLIRAPGRPDSVLTLEKDSDLLRVSCNTFFALLALEDTGFVRCESNFVLLRKLKETRYA